MSVATTMPTVTAAYLGSFVEVVEAFTIVLAVGLTRAWRPALIGASLALLVLTALVAVFGPLLGHVPLHALQFVVGSLLILFGLRWLRKAVLRAAGAIPLHDEAAAFAKQTTALERQSANRRADTLAAVTAFKAVLLEGVEVVFIVVAVGAGDGQLGFASLGAAAAALTVLAVGFVVHRPLARVPENTLKLVVGLMLATFGVFWTSEGLGAAWPGADLSLLSIFAVFTIAAALAVRVVRRQRSGLIGADA